MACPLMLIISNDGFAVRTCCCMAYLPFPTHSIMSHSSPIITLSNHQPTNPSPPPLHFLTLILTHTHTHISPFRKHPPTAANFHSTHSSPARPAAPTDSNCRRPRPWPSRTRTARRLGSPPCSGRSRRPCRRRFAPRRDLWLL